MEPNQLNITNTNWLIDYIHFCICKYVFLFSSMYSLSVEFTLMSVVSLPSSSISPIPTEQIRELADDLAVERRDHQAARQSLEAKTHEAENARRSLEEQSASLQEKTREVERHSHRLAELEHASAAVHEENLELSRRIQEMGRLADEQQAAAGGGPAESPAGEGEGEGEGLAGDRRKELEKLQQAVDMKTRQLEAVKERVRAPRRAGVSVVLLGVFFFSLFDRVVWVCVVDIFTYYSACDFSRARYYGACR